MFISLPRLELNLAIQDKRYGLVIVSAIILSLSNPYWTIWWVTIGLGWLQQSLVFGVLGVACFYCGHIAGDFFWYSLVSLAVAKGRRLLTRRRYQILIGLCAILLCGFALSFLWSGIAGLHELLA